MQHKEHPRSSMMTNPGIGDAEPSALEPQGAACPATQRKSAIYLNDIQVRAYQKWVAAGRPNGDSGRFWLEAEEELVKGH
jgi:hypothetical protein